VFDVDDSGTCDPGELSNCMAMMCGGTLADKVKAAFILFDANNNGTMAYMELTSLIGTVFNFTK
jgi:Ca2+-binding EF-hand superfamily protein